MTWRRSVAVAVVLCAALLAARAQAQQAQPPVGVPQTQQATPQQTASQPAAADESEPIGSVATVFQPAVLARKGGKPALVKKGSDIRRGDQLRTGAGGSLSITFDDETTFTLTAEATITIDEFVYATDRKDGNKGIFSVTRGTISFVASQVAKTGDMRITTPTATLGIRGTTGIVEVPVSGPTQVKLYQDAGGTVGRIEMFGRDGARVAELTRAESGFSLQFVGQRLTAAPIAISPAQLQRDRALVRNVVTHQNLGRQLNEQRRLRDPGRRGQDGNRRDGGRNDNRRDERGRNQDGRNQGQGNRRDQEQGHRDRRDQGRIDRQRRETGPDNERGRRGDPRDGGQRIDRQSPDRQQRDNQQRQQRDNQQRQQQIQQQQIQQQRQIQQQQRMQQQQMQQLQRQNQQRQQQQQQQRQQQKRNQNQQEQNRVPPR